MSCCLSTALTAWATTSTRSRTSPRSQNLHAKQEWNLQDAARDHTAEGHQRHVGSVAPLFLRLHQRHGATVAPSVKTFQVHDVFGDFHVTPKSTENSESAKCYQATGRCFYKKQGVSACVTSCTLGQRWTCATWSHAIEGHRWHAKVIALLLLRLHQRHGQH